VGPQRPDVRPGWADTHRPPATDRDRRPAGRPADHDHRDRPPATYDGRERRADHYDDHYDGRYDGGRRDAHDLSAEDDRSRSRQAPAEPYDDERDAIDIGDTAPRDRRRWVPQPRGAHLPPYSEPLAAPPGSGPAPEPEPSAAKVPDPSSALGGRSPRKLTVTRVAALRSRELTTRMVRMFFRATTADGADVSGLAHLTYAVMGNYAVDAVLTVALANTIFFADTGSAGKVLAYLAITVAPFAVVAPLIGPMLDRLQNGRRLALALSSFGRALLGVLMIFNFTPFNGWVIYPCALGQLVLSKAFSVLKAALTPRVLPEQITLVKTNSRLTVFGLVAGGVAGAVAAGILSLSGSVGALIFMSLCAVGGGILCLRIPAWVESTEGEVPVKAVRTGTKRGFPPQVVETLWANATIRIETGFLALFVAFVVKVQHANDGNFTQLLLLGLVGAAAGVGGFVGNALGARLNLAHPEKLSNYSLIATTASTLIAALIPGLTTACIVGLVGSTASSLAKVCLDSTIQHGLPEESRASAFGKSESVLQLTWVFGGVVGLMIGGVWFGHVAAVYSIGFGVVTALLAFGLAQCLVLPKGRSLIPRIPRKTSLAGAVGPTVIDTGSGAGSRPAAGDQPWPHPDPNTAPPGAPPHRYPPAGQPPFPTQSASSAPPAQQGRRRKGRKATGTSGEPQRQVRKAGSRRNGR
jgi:MFS family permease